MKKEIKKNKEPNKVKKKNRKIASNLGRKKE